MTNFEALLVEDNEAFGSEIKRVVTRAGFDVFWVRDRESYLDWVKGRDPNQPLDLVILDRQLPISSDGVLPTFEVGESIFSSLLDSFGDTPIVHLTGHAEYEHIIQSVRDRPRIRVGPAAEEIDSVYYFRKSDMLGFLECVGRIGEVISRVDNIELNCAEDLTAVQKRILKRVALECRGQSITAKQLSGGMSGATVWNCQISGDTSVGNSVIIKVSSECEQISQLQLSTPSSSNIVSPVFHVQGLCSGFTSAVYQIAGDRDLFAVLDVDTEFAVEMACAVLTKLSNQSSTARVSLESLVSPLVKWHRVEEFCSTYGIRVPSKSKWVTIRLANQHGDLHPANIMVSDSNDSHIIDLDTEGRMSSILDSLTLFWSVLFHKSSGFREIPWPSTLEFEAMIAPNNSLAVSDWKKEITALDPWFDRLWDVMKQESVNSNEYWGLLLGYAARQLKYRDVQNTPATHERAVNLLRISAEKINAS